MAYPFHTRYVLLYVAAFLALAYASALMAQNPVLTQAAESGGEENGTKGQEAPAITVDTVEAARAEVAALLETASSAAAEDTAQQLGVPLDALQGRVDRLRALDGILQQQLGALQRADELDISQQDLQREIAIYEERGLEEPPPYTLEFAEGLSDDVAAEQRKLEGLEAELASIETEQEAVKARLGEAQRSRRAANEAATQNEDPAAAQRLTWTLNRAKLEERYQQASVDARRLRKDLVAREIELSQARIQHLENKAAGVMALTQFEREELEQRLADVAERRAAVEEELPELREAHQESEAKRNAAREALQQAQGDETSAALTDKLALRTLQVETAARKV